MPNKVRLHDRTAPFYDACGVLVAIAVVVESVTKISCMYDCVKKKALVLRELILFTESIPLNLIDISENECRNVAMQCLYKGFR
jgi:hypothetical protein